MRKLYLIAGAFLALAACATDGVRVETREVKIPVATQPIAKEQIPTPPGSLGKRPPSAQQAADQAFGGWCQAVAFIIRAVPLLNISAGLPAAQAPAYPECEHPH
jgi:hypothetical protein